MEFDEWATDYFGENVTAPEACRDAWNQGREQLKALIQEARDTFVDVDLSDWPELKDQQQSLMTRIRDALGEPMTDSERLTAAGYRRRPGRKAIGEDE